MTPLPRASTVLPAGHGRTTQDLIALTYEERFLRRKRLTLASGKAIMFDFAHATALDAGQALECSDGTLVEVQAKPEELLKVAGPDLATLAWHIGNRHTPCQITPEYLLIQANPVLAHMLETLGATVTPIEEVFTPEGGAYGTGRTMGHSHDHDHAHDHAHGHMHHHEQSHDPK